MALDPKLLEPFDGDEPAGANLRYDPVYDEIKEARTEEPDVPQGDWERARKTADWSTVVRLCTDVLRDRSKDLQVAAWLTEGLLNQEGFGGFRDGVDLVRNLLESCWDHLYPEIDDGDLEFRVVPLEWLAGYLDLPVRRVPLTQEGHGHLVYRKAREMGYEEDVAGDSQRQAARAEAVAEGHLTPEQFDEAFELTPKSWYKALVADLDGSLEAVEELDGVSEDLFGDLAPSYRKLRDALEEVRKSAVQLLDRKLEADPDPPEEESREEVAPAAEDESAAESDDPAPARAGGGDESPAAVVAPTVVTKQLSSREQAAAAVASAAAFLRKEDPTDPASYLMIRGLRWGELRRGGDDIDPRLLEAPATPVRTRLKGLLLDARWDELLHAAEEVMASPQGRGWLDLQRYILTALDGLGPSYETIAHVLRRALADLLEELPGLVTATLMDDSPTANRETLDWLRESGIYEHGQEPAEKLRAPRPTGGAGVSTRAADLVRAGRPRQAIELLMREAEQETSARARFLRRSEAARIMLDSGLDAVALPILREMLERIERHTLEDWEEGDVVAVPLALLWRSLRAAEGESAQVQELYKRVCRLDPLAALDLTPSATPAEDATPAPPPTEGEGGGEA